MGVTSVRLQPEIETPLEKLATKLDRSKNYLINQAIKEFLARKIADSIQKGITQLKTSPYLGVEVELAPNPEMIRDLIIGNYITRYLTHTKQIYILRIWHHKEERL